MFEVQNHPSISTQLYLSAMSCFCYKIFSTHLFITDDWNKWVSAVFVCSVCVCVMFSILSFFALCEHWLNRFHYSLRCVTSERVKFDVCRNDDKTLVSTNEKCSTSLHQCEKYKSKMTVKLCHTIFCISHAVAMQKVWASKFVIRFSAVLTYSYRFAAISPSFSLQLTFRTCADVICEIK